MRSMSMKHWQQPKIHHSDITEKKTFEVLWRLSSHHHNLLPHFHSHPRRTCRFMIERLITQSCRWLYGDLQFFALPTSFFPSNKGETAQQHSNFCLKASHWIWFLFPHWGTWNMQEQKTFSITFCDVTKHFAVITIIDVQSFQISIYRWFASI